MTHKYNTAAAYQKKNIFF